MKHASAYCRALAGRAVVLKNAHSYPGYFASALRGGSRVIG
jgi:hypothetical protein